MKEEKNMNKIGKILITIGIFLIITSATLLIYTNYKEYKAGIKSQEALTIIKNNYDDNNKTIINQKEISNNIKEMETTTINGYDYIGSITIPTLNLELPIMSDYDYNRLNIAPCRYYGSIYTNDLIICAHSYETHFKNIINLKQNDKIIITDISGNIYIYEVLEIEILNPKEVSKMIDNEFDLTLYTCTNDGLNRITIRCNRLINSI